MRARWLRILLVSLALLGLGIASYLWLAGRGSFGGFDSERASPRLPRRNAAQRAAIDAAQVGARSAGAGPAQSRILFGDLHVHTTISFDAFMLNLPLAGGAGAHPPADACDFARHCAALDFWSINDHAANIHPRDWRNTIASIRQCNALAGDPANPDLVSFLGWEWTQVGATPELHYGHKNVVLAGLGDGEIPTRPIAASAGGTAAAPPSVWARGAMTLLGPRFHDLALRWTALGALPLCGEGPVRSLPADCREVAATPDVLFRKLDEWGHDSLVIPHGTAWGIYTPPASRWDHQLRAANHDAARQTLLEVYSGHGDSEAYRPWRALLRGPDGKPHCPEARPDYLPMCRRAGQIVKRRCLDTGETEAACEIRAEQARRHAAAAGVSAHATVPGARATDWGDAGQCRDCDQPAYHYRPGGSAQYIAALSDFSQDPPRRFRMGFITSSDIHSGRAGTGYKELRAMSDAGGGGPQGPSPRVTKLLLGEAEPPASHSRSLEQASEQLRGFQLLDTERAASYLYTGGLVAVHAEGRSREAIWSALGRKQVYGTSGPRILLWFDLLGTAGTLPMGSETRQREAPRLRVRAAGSFEQSPGCPDSVVRSLGAEALNELCLGECYHPGDRRRSITRIEVVRIRPQSHPGEDPAELINDPWRRFDCPPAADGCVAEFVDEEFAAARRDTLYYARVFEAPIQAFNADNLGCRKEDPAGALDLDSEGACANPRPCALGASCSGRSEPRAWSSPIYVDYAAP